MNKRTQLALLLTLVLAAFMASKALATTPATTRRRPTPRPPRSESRRRPRPRACASRALAAAAACTSGAHTLSQARRPRLSRDGQRRLHERPHRRHLVYDAPSEQFLPGTHVVLTDRATQCLTDFSLDFERTHGRTAPDGPDLTVGSVTVNGQPATFTFVQPTYPGDPNGPGRPRPAGAPGVAGQPGRRPDANPIPPACSPAGHRRRRNAQNGEPCPANKLVITPRRRSRAGEVFTVTVNYTGRPGVHLDGDGSTEGWFRYDHPAGDGGFVTTEPVGTEAWMPLNNHPSAKPTYDFYDTRHTPAATAIANGELLSHASSTPRPTRDFPGGSTTWHWRSREPVASYLVENSVGRFDLTARLGSDGIRYYEAQAQLAQPPRRRRSTGRSWTSSRTSPTSRAGSTGRSRSRPTACSSALPAASFEEEMQTKITFAGGRIEPARHVQPREHAPVVGRQRLRGAAST